MSEKMLDVCVCVGTYKCAWRCSGVFIWQEESLCIRLSGHVRIYVNESLSEEESTEKENVLLLNQWYFYECGRGLGTYSRSFTGFTSARKIENKVFL